MIPCSPIWATLIPRVPITRHDLFGETLHQPDRKWNRVTEREMTKQQLHCDGGKELSAVENPSQDQNESSRTQIYHDFSYIVPVSHLTVGRQAFTVFCQAFPGLSRSKPPMASADRSRGEGEGRADITWRRTLRSVTHREPSNGSPAAETGFPTDPTLHGTVWKQTFGTLSFQCS